MKDTLTNNVRQYRTSEKVTQEELGKAIGVSRQTIISIERGNYTPSIVLALKIAQFFKIPVEEVFHLTNSVETTPANPVNDTS